MVSKMNFFCALLVCGLLNTALAQETKCKTCMANYAYCVDERNYHLCLGKNPSSTLLSCAENEVCTSTDAICVAKTEATAIPVCESPCGKCGTSPFTCVSRTQFGRCVNNVATAISSCDADEVCSMDLFGETGNLCAPQCVMDFFGYESTCSNDIVTTTTTTVAPAPTPSASNLIEQCNAAEEAGNPAITYYFIPNTVDTNCHTYIYCENVVTMEAYLYTCKTGKFYDETTKKCVDNQPANCPRPSVSTTTTASPTTANPNTDPELTSTTTEGNTESAPTTDGSSTTESAPTTDGSSTTESAPTTDGPSTAESGPTSESTPTTESTGTPTTTVPPTTTTTEIP